MQALQSRAATARELAEVRNRVSTGLRVAGAKDEAAGYVISRQVKSQIVGWDAVTDSLARGQATVAIARTGVEAMSEVLIQVRQTLMSLSSATGEQERLQLREQIKALVARSDAIAHRSTYNGFNLLSAQPAAPPPPPPPQPADFLLPFPTAPSNGVHNWNLNAGPLGGRVELKLNLGASIDIVEIWQDDKRRAFTKNNAGLVTLDFNYDPLKGQNLQVRFNEGAPQPGADWSVTSLKVEYTEQLSSLEVADTEEISVLASPQRETIKLGRWALLSDTLHLRDLTTESSITALNKLELAIERVNLAAAHFGSLEAQMDRRLVAAGKMRSSLEARIGDLVDADLQRESARLVALNTREQLAAKGVSVTSAATRVLLELFKPAA